MFEVMFYGVLVVVIWVGGLFEFVVEGVMGYLVVYGSLGVLVDVIYGLLCDRE